MKRRVPPRASPRALRALGYIDYDEDTATFIASYFIIYYPRHANDASLLQECRLFARLAPDIAYFAAEARCKWRAYHACFTYDKILMPLDYYLIYMAYRIWVFILFADWGLLWWLEYYSLITTIRAWRHINDGEYTCTCHFSPSSQFIPFYISLRFISRLTAFYISISPLLWLFVFGRPAKRADDLSTSYATRIYTGH